MLLGLEHGVGGLQLLRLRPEVLIRVAQRFLGLLAPGDIVADDRGALAAMRDLLAPGGRVVLVIPALRPLYGSIDEAIGHHRRYTRDEIVHKLADAGLTVEHLSFFNVLGVAGWFLNARILRRRTVPGVQARLNDRLVPLLRLERRLRPPLGMSLLAVGRVDPA